jgi:signal transduction histidine kinase
MKRTDRILPAVAILLMLTVCILAYWQYRWLGQISDGELAILRTNLKTSASRFAEEFESTMSRLYDTFEMRTGLQGPTAAMLDSAWLAWRTDGPAPGLIRNLFFIRYEPPVEPRLFRVHKGEFQTSEWTDSLGAIRSVLERQVRHNDDSNRVFVFQTSLSAYYPLVVVSCRPLRNFLDMPRRQPTLDYVVMELDTAYLKTAWFPELFHKHFPGNDGGYTAGVFSKRRGRFLIGPAPPVSEASLIADLPDIAASGMFLISIVDSRRDVHTARIEARLEQTLTRGKSPLSGHATSDNDLQLHVFHPSGSLENAVTQSRRRNLVLGAAVLGLLALSVVFLLAAVQRSRRTAVQQMEFVAGVTHELRTPLAVIRSAAENIADGVIRDDDKLREYGSLIRRQGLALGDMVEQILDYAEIESGRNLRQRQRLDLSALLGETLTDFERAHGSSVVIRYNKAGGPLYIRVDRHFLQSAIRNLLDNAVKYSPVGKPIDVHLSNQGNKIVLSVEDRGSGISPDEVGKIFEPFYRGENARLRQIRGNGLGLAIVKRIVEHHGGRIDVRSEIGRGTVFTVELPLAT